MKETLFDPVSNRLFEMLRENKQKHDDLHEQFLELRQKDLKNMRSIIERQMREMGGLDSDAPAKPQALFTAAQLDAFGLGSISGCLGPDFSRYDGMRIPRIPNRDLRMMDRVVEIQGERRKFSAPASVTVEYDVPTDAWYLSDAAFPDLPYALWMETALQPCGFLSAYLDTYSLIPADVFYFRNLDGSAQMGDWMDVRGKTITTRAKLLTHVTTGGTVIQKFAFELTCAGQKLFWGESTFGYFTAQTMGNQVGLDNGQRSAPVFQTVARVQRAALRIDPRSFQVTSSARPHDRLAVNRLHFLDQVHLHPHGGRHSHGSIYASRMVNPQDWFYSFHFFQDPVMPGSLGVEAILEAMQLFALANGFSKDFRSPRFRPSSAQPFSWRYRGQITPQHQKMELEVDIRHVESQPERVLVVGDASLWVDGLRIYEVKNAAIEITEA
jgi:3-hydroxymyristoyl/3-hydroxydecanoyl-(acyl carrier protein) dehydratase